MITVAEVKAFVPRLAHIGTGSLTTIAFTVNGSEYAITDSANGFVTVGFRPGHLITITSALDATNDGIYTVGTVAAGKITLDRLVVAKSAVTLGATKITGPGTDYTTRIETLIPIVENKLCILCNNHFLRVGLNVGYYETYYEASAITFSASAKTISSPGAAFTDFQFAAADDIYIRGSLKNDGHYNLKTVAATLLTLESVYSLKDEFSQTIVELYMVDFPKELKPVLARMIEYELLIKPTINPAMTSESIGGYSYTKDGKEYPGEILGDLEPYKPNFV